MIFEILSVMPYILGFGLVVPMPDYVLAAAAAQYPRVFSLPFLIPGPLVQVSIFVWRQREELLSLL